jgi:hypothetical protein
VFNSILLFRISAKRMGVQCANLDLVNAYEPNDVRKDATIMFRGQTLWDGVIYNSSAPNERYNYKLTQAPLWKPIVVTRIQSNKNLRIFRYGEMLLIKAESEMELNNLTEAKTALNQIRKGRGFGKYNSDDQRRIKRSHLQRKKTGNGF